MSEFFSISGVWATPFWWCVIFVFLFVILPIIINKFFPEEDKYCWYDDYDENGNRKDK